MECGEQRYALRNDVRWRGRPGNCGRRYAGKDMMAASMSAGQIHGLAVIVLRKISGVVMRLRGNGMMVPGIDRCGVSRLA